MLGVFACEPGAEELWWDAWQQCAVLPNKLGVAATCRQVSKREDLLGGGGWGGGVICVAMLCSLGYRVIVTGMICSPCSFIVVAVDPKAAVTPQKCCVYVCCVASDDRGHGFYM